MPKEVIQFPATDGISGTELSAHWSKNTDPHRALDEDGVVQLALTNHVWGRVPEPDSDALAFSHPGQNHRGHEDCQACQDRNAALKAAGEPPEHGALVEASGSSVVSEFDPSVSIVTKPLTRAEINRLIRVLRTARDQAFGADA